jgi:hypothetical protein
LKKKGDTARIKMKSILVLGRELLLRPGGYLGAERFPVCIISMG